MSGAEITLRPVVAQDDAFLLSVYAGTRAQEMAMVPWTPEQKDTFVQMQFTAQKQHYAAQFPGANHDLICVQGMPVGRLYLDRGTDTLSILDITILPEFRNRGTGSNILRRLMEEGRASGRAVSIHVENFNPSLRLFERLGFQRAGENGFQLLMKWQPAD